MLRTLIRASLLAGLLLAYSSVAHAQITDSEIFRVTIQDGLSIQAPSPLVSQIHDETDNDQNFPNQVWLVTANNNIGATVTFETNQAFTHTLDNSYKRNAAISLSVASGPAWTVTTANAQTDYGLGTEVVSVGAESNVAGNATFNVGVTFLEETFSELASGDYELTVIGTLTAK